MPGQLFSNAWRDEQPDLTSTGPTMSSQSEDEDNQSSQAETEDPQEDRLRTLAVVPATEPVASTRTLEASALDSESARHVEESEDPPYTSSNQRKLQKDLKKWKRDHTVLQNKNTTLAKQVETLDTEVKSLVSTEI